MEVYPPEYVCHNLPLMLVCGLTSPRKSSFPSLSTSDPASPISTPIPESLFPNGQELLRTFLENSEGRVWEESAIKSDRKSSVPVFRVLAVAKNYELPLKKASPMSPISVSSFTSNSKPTTTHSSLSPLSPESPLYPDGIINQFWLKKYHNYLPAIFVSFHELFTDTEDTQVKLSHDNDLIKEISELKKQLSERNVKLVCVIASRRTILQSIDVNDRVTYLRRATNLDAKTGLFFLPPSSAVEIQVFVKEYMVHACLFIILTIALLKHARRKRGRNVTPPNSATSASQILNQAGWNIRYEFKQAVFAEYRQEVDVAVKLYGTAYESLLEYFEYIPTDSPRWNEARMLLDTIAFKILKLNLYQNLPVMAQKVFNVHIESVTALIETKFSTIDTYCYYAWKARQYHMLAELLDMVPENISPRSVPFASVGTDIVGPDFPSANVLHHAGFQYLYAARCTLERRVRALRPVSLPSDLYLVPPPGQEQRFDHIGLLLHLLENAYSRFSRGDGMPTRMQSYIAYELLQTHFKNDDFVNSLKYFHLAVGQYRKEKWNMILARMLSDAVVAAKRSGNREELVRLRMEGLSREFVPWNPDVVPIYNFLDEFDDVADEKPVYEIESDSITPFVEVHFAFMANEGHLASSVSSQLTVHALQSHLAGRLEIASIQLNFTQGLSVIVKNDHSESSATHVQRLSLTDEEDFKVSKACLNFMPDQMRTFEFPVFLKSLGIFEATSVIMSFEGRSFVAKLAIDLEAHGTHEALSKWWVESDEKIFSQRLTAPLPRAIKVIPKQPHIDIEPEFKGPAYVGEKLTIPLLIVNREKENIDVSLRVKVQNVEGKSDIPVLWADNKSESSMSIGEIAPSESQKCQFSVQMPAEACDLVVDIVATYCLQSDPGVEITKTHNIDLPVIFPFQVSYDLTPRIYPRGWPSPFFIYELESHSPPITKRWCLSATIDAVDLQHLKIHDYDFNITNPVSVVCKILDDGPKTFSRQGKNVSDAYLRDFILDVTNDDAVEKRIATADAQLVLSWRRTTSNSDLDSTHYNSFALPLLKLTFPLLEPRVLMDVESTSSENVQLVYYVENATSHILTFSVTLDLNNDMSLSYPVRHQLRQQSYSKESILDASAQEEERPSLVREKVPLQHSNFSYEGAKQVGVRVLPYSTRKVEFSLLPLAVTSGWQRVPSLRVYDTHFKKSLSVFPASAKFRIDFKTGAVYVNISASHTEK